VRFLFKDNLFIVIIKTNQMNNQIIKPNSINFQELVNGNNDKLTITFKSKMIDKLELNFTEFQSRWYIANVYAYSMYHSTKDFPINIDTIYKLIGFANKANAKRALINNFTKDEDYKININNDKDGKGVFIPRDENLGGRPDETIMLNIDTFKSLCMIVKTDKAKEIRKYYIRLENIINEIVDEERKEYERLLIESKALLEIKIQEFSIEKLISREKCYIETLDKKPIMYIFKINEDEIKLGETNNIKERIKVHKNQISKNGITIFAIEFEKNYELEQEVLRLLQGSRIEKVYNGKNQTEIIKLSNDLTIDKVIAIIINTKKSFGTIGISKEERILELQLQIVKEETKQLQFKIELQKCNDNKDDNNKDYNNKDDGKINYNKNIIDFYEEFTIYDNNESSKIALKLLYEMYKKYCNDKNVKSSTKMLFSKSLQNKYDYKNKTNVGKENGIFAFTFRKIKVVN
jgi:phage anti-repressor protein